MGIPSDYREFAPPDPERMLGGRFSCIDAIRNLLLRVIAEQAYHCRWPADMPHETGIYFVFERGHLVYVGKACDLHNRWRGHFLRDEVRDGRMQLYWKRVDRESFCDGEHEEAGYIVFLRPQYNRVARCKVLPEWWKTFDMQAARATEAPNVND